VVLEVEEEVEVEVSEEEEGVVVLEGTLSVTVDRETSPVDFGINLMIYIYGSETRFMIKS
ncbi:hypothetical protein EI555_000563, partial [Monodon monoceros]